jgi:AraC-like DNA-binding protein
VAVLLDTSHLPSARRAEAVAEVFQFSGARARVVYDCSDDQVSARFEYFTLGGAHVVKARISPLGLIATPALLKDTGSDLLAVTLKLIGTATHTQAPGRLLRPGDLFITNLSLPYEYVDDGGENAGFHVPLAHLGLPRDYATRASEVIHTSPLAVQLQQYLQLLFRDADAISQGPAASAVAQATTDLVRAALISAVDEESFRRYGQNRDLNAGAKSYIAQHLADPSLGAEQIARAMFISVRQVYKLWESEPHSLGQWILERKLEAARDQLTSSLGRNQTVAAIARRWGFADPTHFSRRFRLAYGMSPREWRHTHRNPATLTVSSGTDGGSVHA